MDAAWDGRGRGAAKRQNTKRRDRQTRQTDCEATSPGAAPQELLAVLARHRLALEHDEHARAGRALLDDRAAALEAQHLGFGRTVASEKKKAPNLFVNLV